MRKSLINYLFKSHKGDEEDASNKKKEHIAYNVLRPKNVPRRVLLDNMMVVERYLDAEEEDIKDKTSDEGSDQKSFKEWSPQKSPDKEIDRDFNEKAKVKKKELEPTVDDVKREARRLAEKREAKRLQNRHKDKDQLEISMLNEDGDIDLPQFTKQQVDSQEDRAPDIV